MELVYKDLTLFAVAVFVDTVFLGLNVADLCERKLIYGE